MRIQLTFLLEFVHWEFNYLYVGWLIIAKSSISFCASHNFDNHSSKEEIFRAAHFPEEYIAFLLALEQYICHKILIFVNMLYNRFIVQDLKLQPFIDNIDHYDRIISTNMDSNVSHVTKADFWTRKKSNRGCDWGNDHRPLCYIFQIFQHRQCAIWTVQNSHWQQVVWIEKDSHRHAARQQTQKLMWPNAVIEWRDFDSTNKNK